MKIYRYYQYDTSNDIFKTFWCGFYSRAGYILYKCTCILFSWLRCGLYSRKYDKHNLFNFFFIFIMYYYSFLFIITTFFYRYSMPWEIWTTLSECLCGTSPLKIWFISTNSQNLRQAFNLICNCFQFFNIKNIWYFIKIVYLLCS